jgi:hypothetical protein
MQKHPQNEHPDWWRDPSPHVSHVAWLRFFMKPSLFRAARMRPLVTAMLLMFGVTCFAAEAPRDMPSITSIQGTWTLAFADVLHPDGKREADYGDHPKGLMQVDSAGRYTVFIFDTSRPHFASAEKKTGTDAEIKAAFFGTSSHYGTVTVGTTAHTLDFHIEGSTYPNLEGTTQRRRFESDGNTLTYRVPPRSNGDVPLTGWKRLSPLQSSQH